MTLNTPIRPTIFLLLIVSYSHMNIPAPMLSLAAIIDVYSDFILDDDETIAYHL